MAAAGAATATTKPPRSAHPDPESERKLLPHEIRWRQYFAERGFVQTPRDYFTKLPVGLSGIEHAIVGQILARTIGGVPSRTQPHRPEFVAITIPELARLFDYSVNSISAALARLVKWGVLAVRPVASNKRANEYSCLIEGWASLDVRAMRKERATLKPDDAGGETDDAAADEASDDSQPGPERAFGTSRRCKPGATATITIAEPVRKIRLANETGLAVAVSVAEDTDGVTVRVEAAAERQTEGEASVKNTPNSLGESTRGRLANTPNKLGVLKPTSVANKPLSGEAVEFERALNESFASQVGSPAPAPLVAAQFARLDAAAVGQHVFWQRARKRAAAFTEWGFLVSLVDDVVAVASIERGKLRTVPPPSPALEPERPDPLEKFRGATYRGGA